MGSNIFSKDVSINQIDDKITMFLQQKQFKIEKYLDQGYFAEVFQAIKIDDNRRVVIKKLKDLNNLKKIEDEKNAMYKIQNEQYAIQIITDLVDKDLEYNAIVMELCDCNLTEIFENNISNFSFEQLVTLTYQLLKGLLVFQEKGIIHGDLKPENILYSQQKNRFLISDLGLSQVMQNPELQQLISKQSNSLVGNIKYMAPEIIHQRKPQQLKLMFFQQDKFSLSSLQKGNQLYQSILWYVLKLLKDQNLQHYFKDIGDYYQGYQVPGLSCKLAKFFYPTGAIYEGQVKDSKRHGLGKYTYSNGNVYEGDWFENKQNGEGRFVYAEKSGEGGDIYNGQFKDDKFEGFGHYYYKKSGRQYIGFFSNDKWNGEGKFINANGEIIKSGIWKDDKLQTDMNVAEIVTPKQFQHLIIENFEQKKDILNQLGMKDFYFEGNYQKLNPQCKYAKIYYDNGIYEGSIQNGKKQGIGKFMFANGNVYVGNWFENQQNGQGRFMFDGLDSDIYNGEFKKGKFEGFGHYYYNKSGKQYIGFFSNDKWNGQGKFISANGEIIKSGIWKDDKLETDMNKADILVPNQFKHLIIQF
ncbi:tyrosine kinase domain protein (macronuclear) [Tetrahymena thermophila SB210]|uniref:Tyrosine kinase domain protein n=1 Tax=Tetrahymena thermophila (strain SB210) TaxID=312017 RepID=I7LUS6_TETTS|nr:tyrosine kinase domain protein [Tetrahymena thermophila SB210]EAR95959.2 tyrosine kinase domain protein [Tetrahymena thermophila SB210]|eukprot:XP_001016204.2 tyrosine kinase domain protein [Tetrahymena thermophila SB210]